MLLTCIIFTLVMHAVGLGPRYWMAFALGGYTVILKAYSQPFPGREGYSLDQ